MGALAELIGYDEVTHKTTGTEIKFEGAIEFKTIRRRERNPRNRMLCLRLHGKKCIVCGTSPSEIYGEAGNIIEVHHLEPLSKLREPRPYDPEHDLVPLCPNCHRAIHTRTSSPFSPKELREIMGLE